MESSSRADASREGASAETSDVDGGGCNERRDSSGASDDGIAGDCKLSAWSCGACTEAAICNIHN